MYRYTESGAIQRESDGAFIPCDPLNRDYRKIMDEGAEIAPYVAPERGPKELTLPQLTDLVEYLMSGEPQIREVEKIVERVVEVPAAVVEAEAPVDSLGEELERTRRANRQMVNGEERSSIPAEIAELMEEGETLPQARRRLTELLFVEQAELKNLRGMAGEDLPREAQIEKLLGLFARLGEI